MFSFKDSFLPSTNATGCRNSSHPSVDSPINQGANSNLRLRYGGSAPPAMMSSEFALRASAKLRIKELFDAKTSNIQNQLRREISKTLPLSLRLDSADAPNSRSSNRRDQKSAPSNDLQIDPMRQTPDSSIGNDADQDDVLLIDQNLSHDIHGDIDDNISVRS